MFLALSGLASNGIGMTKGKVSLQLANLIMQTSIAFKGCKKTSLDSPAFVSFVAEKNKNASSEEHQMSERHQKAFEAFDLQLKVSAHKAVEVFLTVGYYQTQRKQLLEDRLSFFEKMFGQNACTKKIDGVFGLESHKICKNAYGYVVENKIYKNRMHHFYSPEELEKLFKVICARQTENGCFTYDKELTQNFENRLREAVAKNLNTTFVWYSPLDMRKDLEKFKEQLAQKNERR